MCTSCFDSFKKNRKQIQMIKQVIITTAITTFGEIIITILKRKNLFPKLNQKNAYNILRISIIVAAIIILFVIYFEYTNDNKTARIVVYPWEESLSQHPILLSNEKNYVIIDLNGYSRKQIVDENNRAVFEEVPNKFIGDSSVLTVDMKHYEIADKNLQFLESNKPIYLKLKKKRKFITIAGIVRNSNGASLDGVNILIGIDTVIKTTSDGKFNLLLPFKMQHDNFIEPYKLILSKKGYQSKEYEYEQGSEIAEIKLEKSHE